MREELIAQYGGIRETIRTNIQTIGKLIQQAEALKGLVNRLTNDTEIKNSLEKEIEEIEGTIKSLITQTDRLFDSYNSFVAKVFESK